MAKNILQAFVAEVIQEGGYWKMPSRVVVKSRNARSPQKKGIVQRIMSLMSSKKDVDKIVDEWLDDQLLYYDFDPTDEQLNNIHTFAEKKWKDAVKKSNGDADRSARILTTALDKRYRRVIQSMQEDD